MQFLGKNRVSEWKLCCFFYCCIFFPAPWEWVSEWYVNFSWGKKIQKNVGKKNTRPKFENLQKMPNLTFFNFFFRRYYFFFEWVAFKLFLKKKNFIFFSGKKQQNSLKSSEWVGYKLFREKKYDTFGNSEVCTKCPPHHLNFLQHFVYFK